VRLRNCYMTKNQIKNILIELDDAFDFLGWKYNIQGMTKDDIKQELRLMVLQLCKNKKNGVDDKGLGWWFNRAQWHLLNKLTRSKRKPLDKSISLDSFKGE